LSRYWDRDLGNGVEPAEPVPQMFFRPGQLVMDPAKVAAIKVIKPRSTFLDRLKKTALKDNHWQAIRQALVEKKTGIDGALSLSERLIFYKNRWYVPEGRDLCQEIFSQNHNSRTAGHFEQFKTANKIKANFYWPNMDQDIEEYVHSCDCCQGNMTACHMDIYIHGLYSGAT
jgi:hypothetical protein